ncbi:protein Fe65 homolog isoform X2 [Macrosteles quadrilineatus]|uniref:protein Fe65 homolog isoform X2 n=1 Tax=Macrosteles quadrilineatus TaxID=74068 RepID=UPI0023E348EE|nr:protein Fe65 homolog isoform X2 [Macrosteles quadrilineatus]
MVRQRFYEKNGLLSYENPNYHLDPSRLDDALNSNTEEDPLYSELLLRELGRHSNTTQHNTTQRRQYASLDIGSMGVDVTTGPVTALDTDNRHLRGSAAVLDNTLNLNLNRGGLRGNLDLTTSTTLHLNKPDLIEATEHNNAFEKTKEINRSIPHIPGQLNNDLYAVPVKRRSPPGTPEKVASAPPSPDVPNHDLPAGWERHEDNDGPYYWHIKSGTIQRDPPESDSTGKNEPRTPLVKDAESVLSAYQQTGVVSLVTRSNTSYALEDLDTRKKEDLAFKRRSYPARPEPDSKDKVIRFAVRSLGWVEIAEEDLTPERSSKAVNKCIVDLSLGRNDLIDNVGRWGDGKDLFMDLDEGALKLIDPENLTTLNTQPIHTIRVWGVGRDNGRDFAYVARDRTTRKHMCHVFRCDIPARTIANTLRDICKKIMIERSLQQNLAKPIDINGGGLGSRAGLATRPTNLPVEHRRFHRNGQTLVTQSFPTPMEEPKKVLRADYLGSLQVARASGMDVLNDAIEQLVNTVPVDQWRPVSVSVAPSMITINDDECKPVAECRVRYLSFLGIGQNVKQCAFIMHTAQDLFIAHVFHCEPSSGALCKTIEAACKLRYQKCLDAHPGRATAGAGAQGKGLGATIKSLVSGLTGRRSRTSES